MEMAEKYTEKSGSQMAARLFGSYGERRGKNKTFVLGLWLYHNG